ncbi:MAG: translesion error-prone DNA polymerase V autoproteolytic subunit [Candidatus Omnitrophica bacterium]|nr:translesion error-prone DNA polymerase V autoproteolytic subunit [Candidatus Omnitrophota bacterium]
MIRPRIQGCRKERREVLPLFVSPVAAGFPSPADDYIDKSLDLNEHLIQRPAATFFVRVEGDSMINAGIMPGSLLIVDRSVTPANGSIIVAILDGEFTVKRYKKTKDEIILSPENPRYEPVVIKEGRDFEVWGVVQHVIQSFTAKSKHLRPD